MLVRTVPLDGGTGGTATGGDPAVVGDPVVSGRFDAAPGVGRPLPCREAEDADLWFAEAPAELEQAKVLCGDCPIKAECLAGALRRAEPWGVWGGEILQRGAVIARKRPKGRPSKAALRRDRELAAAGAPL